MLSFAWTQSLTEAGVFHVCIDDLDISFGEISAETFWQFSNQVAILQQRCKEFFTDPRIKCL